MPDPNAHHVSSAVVITRPECMNAVAAEIAAMEATEVHAAESGRVIVVLEGKSAGELGNRLNAIAGINGVIAANMVFEQIIDTEAI